MSGTAPVTAPLETPRTERGVTLVELMIGLAVLALLMMSGAPAFSDWIRNTRIRSATESILSGIQYARSEAVRRNTAVRFQLTDTLDNACKLSSAGRNWVVNAERSEDPKGKCDTAMVGSDSQKGHDHRQYPAPYILQKAALVAGSTMVTVEMKHEAAVTEPVVVFNGLGQQTSLNGVDPDKVVIKITSPQVQCATSTATANANSADTARCLHVVLRRDGQAFICDPTAKKTGTTRVTACDA